MPQRRGSPGEYGKLQSILARGRSLLVSCDHTGPLEKTIQGYEYILVFTDHFSRAVELVPVKDVGAETTARAFIDHVCLRWGVPYRLLTDQGSGFTADAFRAMCKMLGVQKIFTTAYHPQANSKCERFNRTMKTILSKLIDKNTLRDWDEQLPRIQWAYNTVIHPATGYAPFFLMYGFDPRIPSDLQYELAQDRFIPESVQDAIKAMDEAYTAALDSANANAVKSASEAARLYDLAHKDPSVFKLHSMVWFYAAPIGNAHKLLLPWIGPFEIVEVVTTNTFRLKDPHTRNVMQQLVSSRRLRPYIPKFRPFGAPDLHNSNDVFDYMGETDGMSDVISAEQDFINKRRSYLTVKKYMDELDAGEKAVKLSEKEILKEKAKVKHALLTKQEKASLKRDAIKENENQQERSIAQARDAFVQIHSDDSKVQNILPEPMMVPMESLENELVEDN